MYGRGHGEPPWTKRAGQNCTCLYFFPTRKDSEASMSIDSVRVLVVGDVAAGKTSLVRLLARGKPVDEAPNPTVGCELEIMLYKYEPEVVKEPFINPLAPWEMRPSEKSRREHKEYFVEFLEIGATHAHAVTRRMFYHDYSGIILVYDLTSPRSCQRLNDWLKELQSHSFEHMDLTDGLHIVSISGEEVRKSSSTPTRKVPVLVVGTKADQLSAIRMEHRYWIDKVLNDNGAREIRLSTERCTDLSPASANAETLRLFYDKVVEHKFSAIFSPIIPPSSPDTRARSYSKYRNAVM